MVGGGGCKERMRTAPVGETKAVACARRSGEDQSLCATGSNGIHVSIIAFLFPRVRPLLRVVPDLTSPALSLSMLIVSV